MIFHSIFNHEVTYDIDNGAEVNKDEKIQKGVKGENYLILISHLSITQQFLYCR